MGKKGKGKKEKITGTPEVVKFKGTREFQLLRELTAIQESLPFVISDILDDFAFKKISRFLNMVGLLAEFCAAEESKEYRFLYHHQLLHPVPQYCPFGYAADVIKAARRVIDNASITYNGKDFNYPEDLKIHADRLLKHVDGYITKIACMIEPSLKDDFSIGLKKFRQDLAEIMSGFDHPWVLFEADYLKFIFGVHTEVFLPIGELVDIEAQLTAAEDELDTVLKQKLENDITNKLEELINFLYPETAERKFPEDTMSLAEAVLFYESKCSEKWQNNAKYVIKDYLKIRLYLTDLASTRMHPEFKDNGKLMRLMKSFHQSVTDAYEALEFVAKLPKLIHAKGTATGNWMTRKLLEADLERIEKEQLPCISSF